MVGLTAAVKECAETAAVALAKMLHASPGNVDTAAIAEVIEQALNEATSKNEEGMRRCLVDLQVPTGAARCFAGSDLQL
jgi:hypothetical protein